MVLLQQFRQRKNMYKISIHWKAKGEVYVRVWIETGNAPGEEVKCVQPADYGIVAFFVAVKRKLLGPSEYAESSAPEEAIPQGSAIVPKVVNLLERKGETGNEFVREAFGDDWRKELDGGTLNKKGNRNTPRSKGVILRTSRAGYLSFVPQLLGKVKIEVSRDEQIVKENDLVALDQLYDHLEERVKTVRSPSEDLLASIPRVHEAVKKTMELSMLLLKGRCTNRDWHSSIRWHIHLRDERGGHLNLVPFAWWKAVTSLESSTIFRRSGQEGKGLQPHLNLWECLEKKKLLLRNVNPDEKYEPDFPIIHCTLDVPIMIGKECVGILSFDSATERESNSPVIAGGQSERPTMEVLRWGYFREDGKVEIDQIVVLPTAISSAAAVAKLLSIIELEHFCQWARGSLASREHALDG